MTLPFLTTEVRWFFESSIPPEIDRWFQQLTTAPGPPSSRKDFYLCLPERNSLGIKLREGKIEVKQRYGQQKETRFANDITGHVEQWRKWSYNLAEPEAALADVDIPPGAWIGVGKRRQLQKFAIEPRQQISQVGPDAFPENGCDLELAQVKIKDTTWWSICLEAYGQERQLWDNLLLVTRHVVGRDVPLSLPAHSSFGYARLLQQLCE